jgi:glycosyltransferase involved in cell wall biosynthesis
LFYTGLAMLGMRARVVHTEHGREPYATRRRTAWLGRIAAGFAEVFYCLTDDMATGVRAARVAPNRKIRVIANGIDTSVYRCSDGADAIRDQLGIPRSAALVGTVGRLTEIKRQDVLIDAFASIRRRHAKAHLLLVGDGPLLPALREQAARLGLGSCVHFAGYQSHTTPFLHAMDLFVLPSRSEGMPQAVLEACVAAKPVIASKVGGIPEVITHEATGLLVPSGDADALAAAMGRALADRPWAAAMARRASDAVTARFDVSRMAAEYHRDFLQLLDDTIPCPRGVPALSS